MSFGRASVRRPCIVTGYKNPGGVNGKSDSKMRVTRVLRILDVTLVLQIWYTGRVLGGLVHIAKNKKRKVIQRKTETNHIHHLIPSSYLLSGGGRL
jgi:hypothetical protein